MPLELRFSDDQPRDPDGKFGSGGGSQSSPHEHDAAQQAAGEKPSASQKTAMTKLLDGPAVQNALGAPVGVAKLPDGTTLNGNMINALQDKGWLETKQTDASRPTTYQGTKTSVKIVEHHLTEKGKKALGRDLSQNSETRETYMSIERRYITELRAGESQGDEMSLVGYAARFNSPSKDLGGFRETIAPGAFTRTLASQPDVKCLFNHSADKVLGRTTSGTLQLEQDNVGLKFRCMLDPNQQSHRDLHSAVKRGDINECSFAFTPNGANGDTWADAKDERGNWFIQRTLNDVDLYDVSPVTHPAYNSTGVQAREANLTPEIRSIISKLVEKRAKAEKRSDEGDSIEDVLREVSAALAEKFPREANGECMVSSWGQYWICETYEDCVIASDETTGEYFKIPYVESPDGDDYVFGQPQPVEKEWVPTERSKKVSSELRAAKDAHMQALANQHKDLAAEHKANSDAHADASAAHQAVADETEKALEAKRQYRKDNGLMDEEEWEDNCMSDRADVHGYERDEADDEDVEEDSMDTRAVKKASREQRAAGKTRTKKVDGKNLPKSAFAFVGDANDTTTWKLPVHDKAHADNAAARLDQTNGIPSEKKASVESKIKAAQKKFGEDAAAAERAEKQMTELRFKAAMLSTEVTQ